MSNYTYQGLFQGKETTGTIEANDRNTAMNLLQRQNIIVTLLKAKKAAADNTIKTFMGMQLASDKLKDTDVLMFTTKLETMIKAKLPIMEALKLSRKQAKKPGLIKVTRSIIDDLNNGLTFSTGLKKFPKVFDESYINAKNLPPFTHGILASYAQYNKTNTIYPLVNAFNKISYSVSEH